MIKPKSKKDVEQLFEKQYNSQSVSDEAFAAVQVIIRKMYREINGAINKAFKALDMLDNEKGKSCFAADDAATKEKGVWYG